MLLTASMTPFLCAQPLLHGQPVVKNFNFTLQANLLIPSFGVMFVSTNFHRMFMESHIRLFRFFSGRCAMILNLLAAVYAIDTFGEIYEALPWVKKLRWFSLRERKYALQGHEGLKGELVDSNDVLFSDNFLFLRVSDFMFWHHHLIKLRLSVFLIGKVVDGMACAHLHSKIKMVSDSRNALRFG